MIVERHGRTFEVADEDFSGDWDFWGRFSNGTWEPETLDLIETMCHGGTFVDIGAWIGPTSLWAAAHADRVVAIEPDPVAFAVLEKNTARLPNIECHQVAVGPADGLTTITTAGDSMSRTGAGDYIVKCYTIKTLFDWLEITDADLIKMDIEGAERDVVAYAEPFLRAFGAPLALSMHPWAPGSNLPLNGWRTEDVGHLQILATP